MSRQIRRYSMSYLIAEIGILKYFLELGNEFKNHLKQNLIFAQDDIVIRYESLKEELEIVKQGYYEQLSRTEKEICE